MEAIDVEPIGKTHAEQAIEVTAIATFSSHSDAFPGLNAAYVTFEAGKRGALEAAADWLEKIYVRQAYGGRILTDFDEQTLRFEHATFSLSKLLNGLVEKADVMQVYDDLNLSGWERDRLNKVFDQRGIFIRGDAYFVQRAAAVGRGSSASDTQLYEGGGVSDGT